MNLVLLEELHKTKQMVWRFMLKTVLIYCIRKTWYDNITSLWKHVWKDYNNNLFPRIPSLTQMKCPFPLYDIGPVYCGWLHSHHLLYSFGRTKWPTYSNQQTQNDKMGCSVDASSVTSPHVFMWISRLSWFTGGVARAAS